MIRHFQVKIFMHATPKNIFLSTGAGDMLSSHTWKRGLEMGGKLAPYESEECNSGLVLPSQWDSQPDSTWIRGLNLPVDAGNSIEF